MKRVVLRVVLIFCLFETSYGQDFQFSHNYAASLFLNPAFAGAEEKAKVMMNFRNQYPELPGSYNTVATTFENYFFNSNSGLALMFFSDNGGVNNYNTKDFGLQYSYKVDLNNDLVLRLGVQSSFVNKRVDVSNFTFGDELSIVNPNQPTNENINQDDRLRRFYIDLSTGGLLFYKKYWIGLALHHLNRPKDSFLSSDTKLPIRYTINMGTQVELAKVRSKFTKERILLYPTYLFKYQGGAFQNEIGAHFKYNHLKSGLYYRGVPYNSIGNTINQESIYFIVGLDLHGFSLAYSYDIPLGHDFGGAFEFSVSYQVDMYHFGRGNKKRSSFNYPCPVF